jgi:hypothetical protein
MRARTSPTGIDAHRMQRRTNRLSCLTAAMALAGMLAAGAAQAVVVVPGETLFLPGTTLSDRPDLAGVDLFNDGLDVRIGHPIWPEGVGAGWQVRQQVVRSEATGALVFSVQLVWDYNITPGDFLVDRLWLDGWGSFATDVDYRTDLSGDRGPSFATRSADGQRLDLAFGFPLVSGNLTGEPHEDSMPITVVTDAKAFTTTGTLTVAGRFSDRPGEVYFGRVDGLAVPMPVPVPEPAVWVTMALGLMALGSLRRRRRPTRSGPAWSNSRMP